VSAVRRRVLAHGRVQGVFFRDSTRERAEARGVAGFVRNLPDGTVEAVFEGPEEAVADLVAFCMEGPEDARVERLDVEPEEPEGLAGFEVA
jgi:acylphosphatase